MKKVFVLFAVIFMSACGEQKPANVVTEKAHQPAAAEKTAEQQRQYEESQKKFAQASADYDISALRRMEQADRKGGPDSFLLALSLFEDASCLRGGRVVSGSSGC